ncbi:MAG: putative manganese transporter [bacterium]
MELLTYNLKQALVISTFVFIMMMMVDYLEILTQGKMSQVIKGGYGRQYLISSGLAVIPGCCGAFMNVSFYLHGLLSFGAITGSMIAASGDEAFVMISLFPKQALILFGLLFTLGVACAWLIDKVVVPLLKIKPCQVCQLSKLHLKRKDCRVLDLSGVIKHLRKISLVRFLLIITWIILIYSLMAGIIGPESWELEKIILFTLIWIAGFIVITAPDHYLEEHIWAHLIKKHLWRIFLWSFFALLLVDLGLKSCNLESFIKAHILWVLLVASLVAIVPESGPHLIFVMMFAKGIIPFSVLLTSSIIQDGHGIIV